jgi:hypothetical protein
MGDAAFAGRAEPNRAKGWPATSDWGFNERILIRRAAQPAAADRFGRSSARISLQQTGEGSGCQLWHCANMSGPH